MVEVCEGAPVAVSGGEDTDRHDLAPSATYAYEKNGSKMGRYAPGLLNVGGNRQHVRPSCPAVTQDSHPTGYIAPLYTTPSYYVVRTTQVYLFTVGADCTGHRSSISG